MVQPSEPTTPAFHSIIQTFPALSSCLDIRHAFLVRAPGVAVDCDRDEALRRLQPAHSAALQLSGLAEFPLALAGQVHGNEVVDAIPGATATGADGLITNKRGICLGIYVADCAAVFLADRTGRGIGLVHSGRKGTDLGIVPRAVQRMVDEFGCKPADLLAFISPCIRPPYYEVDFAARILGQLEESGVGDVVDSGICTASRPDQYYSYRQERGRTGRMLALLAKPL